MKNLIRTFHAKLCIVMILALGLPTMAYGADQLQIGQSINVYLTPNIPSGGWLTSTSWSTDVIGLYCSYSGEWGSMVTANGYWEGVATVSCMYTYSYYGADSNIHVGHNYQYYYYTCKGYPITLTPTNLTLDSGEDATLKFSISGASIGEIAARWESSNTEVATVYTKDTYSATVHAKKPGYCSITCYSYMGEPVTCSVKVNNVKPTSITVDPQEASLEQGQTLKLSYSLTPTYATATITWKSSNTSIATVSSTGLVTAVKEGTTYISASTDNGCSSNCKITVTKKFSNPRGPVSSSLSGTGTKNNPYLIQSAADLRYLADQTKAGKTYKNNYFKLTKDITINTNPVGSNAFFNGELWVPIGYFEGYFDGDNHTISGIYIDDNDTDMYSGSPIGLFSWSTWEIQNLTVSDSYYKIEYTRQDIGGISGYAGNISNCHFFNSTIECGARCWVGGIAGGNDQQIIKCSNNSKIRGYVAAGILGSGATVKDCINSGNIISDEHHSCGISWLCPNIVNCLNTGEISGGRKAFGIGNTNNYTGAHNKFHNNLNLGKIITLKEDGDTESFGNTETAYRWHNRGLLSACPNMFVYSEYDTENDNKLCDEEELKSDETLIALNTDRDSDCSKWVRGANGYPIQEWAYGKYDEIQDITVDESEIIDDFIYDMTGRIVGFGSENLDKLAPGIYIFHKKKILVGQ